MVGLVTLHKVEVVLFAHLALLAEYVPKLRSDALLAHRLITRWRCDIDHALELVRCHCVASQRVGLDDVETICHCHICQRLSFAKYSSVDCYRISLNNPFGFDLGLCSKCQAQHHQYEKYSTQHLRYLLISRSLLL